MASVFELLDEIRERPAMYLGGDDTQRLLQLANLEQLLSGHNLALRRHGIREDVADFNKEFSTYLWEKKGCSASCGALAAVRDAAGSDRGAWELYWLSVDEFRIATSRQIATV
jgi:hypothetical protein